MEKRVVALAVTGSIAAYKAVEVARLCKKRGLVVLPVMTSSATRFVGPVTLSGITGEPVAIDMWDPTFAGELHIALAARADLVAIVPATADLLARLAQGRADDLVAALALCARGPVLAAPAMHPRMWDHPATRANVESLARHGRVQLVGPVSGPVASGEEGLGRMAEPDVIAAAIFAALDGGVAVSDLAGVRVVVTAGPTVEDVDPVRFLGNRSSGKMGFALAARAAARGADVTLVTGPVALPTPAGVRRVDVRSALAMRDVLRDLAGVDQAGFDALVMSAAVADYRPKETSASKIKKQGDEISITLVKNPDLLAEIGAARAARAARAPALIGFAVETGDDEALVAYARGKLASKRVDVVVANAAAEAFGGDDSRALLVDANAVLAVGPASKACIADAVLDRLRELVRAAARASKTARSAPAAG